MSYPEVYTNRVKTSANVRTPLEFWTFGVLRAMFRQDEPGLELLPAGATPATPKQGRVVIFARESGTGTGKYQICTLGPGGTAQILSTEP